MKFKDKSKNNKKSLKDRGRNNKESSRPSKMKTRRGRRKKNLTKMHCS
jgi:hypothetical protein